MKNKFIKILIGLLLLPLSVSCSSKKASSRFHIGEDWKNVAPNLKPNGIHYLEVCDYLFYCENNVDVVLKKSNDGERIVCSETYQTKIPSKDGITFVQMGMNPFAVVSVLGLPKSYEKSYETSLEFHFDTIENVDLVVPFGFYEENLYFCLINGQKGILLAADQPDVLPSRRDKR